MSGQFTIRGLPDRLKHDAWWMIDAPANANARPEPGLGARISDGKAALLALLILIVLADISFWDQTPGLSMALFCMGLSAAMIAFKPVKATRREWAIAMGFALVCNLPVIEHAQPLSYAFSVGGIASLLAWVAQGTLIRWSEALTPFIRASSDGLILLPTRVIGAARSRKFGTDWKALARAYLLPISVAQIFVALFAVANPLFERTLASATDIGPLRGETLLRILFWGAAACILWPYLNTRALRQDAAFDIALPNGDLSAGFLNAGSVRLSLILFNAIFAVQTLSDLTILTGGVALPEGMTYAEYAHRGAYPLLVTALLAGLFAALTHKMVAEDKRMRWLVYAWLGQTLLLVCTAAFRLSLYVQAYALTHLRIAAFIWMGLIALGLILVVIQIVQARSLGWLIRWNAATALATLYLCTFVNFTHIIADHNLSADIPIERLDLTYLCGLGEQVISAMWEYGPVHDDVQCGTQGRPSIAFDDIDSWQEWGFRRWRLEAYLTAHHDL
ncbi:DUF4173 domain-containing protein [Gymnodinialimonas hymeniacidonis]|uniref:DUF4153 domain-containing protein n=1 Tax=Gymnodinialimonas hymeniacidonis TaxID=3126508 RepID=UPI0034C6DE84